MHRKHTGGAVTKFPIRDSAAVVFFAFEYERSNIREKVLMLTKGNASQGGLYFSFKPRRWRLIVRTKTHPIWCASASSPHQPAKKEKKKPYPLQQQRVMGRNNTKELCLGLASCLSAMVMTVKSKCSSDPPPASAIGRIIFLMCADSTQLTVDIMIHRRNLPGYIIAH